jgi:radical SAM protein (TIGR01212 family)
LSVPDVVGLAIGTRPDCIDEEKLTLMETYARTHMVWIEYGLQSAHDDTLRRINRGHDAAAFQRAVIATAGRGIRICAHIILGLPGETRAHMHATADFIAALPLDGVKLHLLYVIRETPLEDLYRSGRYTCLQQTEYADLVCDVIERLPARMVIQRLTGDPHRDELVAPQWALRKSETLNLIKKRLDDREIWQGKMAGRTAVHDQAIVLVRS